MFIVSKKFGSSAPTQLKQFSARSAAEAFIFDKLKEDQLYKVNAIYSLMDDMDEVLQEYTQSELTSADQTSNESSSQQQGQSSNQSFTPTPFNTAPRPAGMPHNWVKDGPKKDTDDKN